MWLKKICRFLMWLLVSPIILIPSIVEWIFDDDLTFKQAFEKGITYFEY